jgi:hemolysin III
MGTLPDSESGEPSYVRRMSSVILAPSIETTLWDRFPNSEHPIYGARPLLRGRFHQAAAVASVPVGIHLVTGVAEPADQLALLVYAVTSALMFLVSAAYHRLAQGVLARFWMRRLDHSMILVSIAGGTTPIALLGVGGTAGFVLLSVSWTGALVGAATKMTRLTADKDSASWIFPVLGVLPLLALPSLETRVGWDGAILLVAAAATYSVGAVCFVRKSPNPMPAVFGYHEVWHVFTLIAATFQFLLTVKLAAL